MVRMGLLDAGPRQYQPESPAMERVLTPHSWDNWDLQMFQSGDPVPTAARVSAALASAAAAPVAELVVAVSSVERPLLSQRPVARLRNLTDRTRASTSHSRACQHLDVRACSLSGSGFLSSSLSGGCLRWRQIRVAEGRAEVGRLHPEWPAQRA